MNERIRELAKEAVANVRFWDAEKEVYDVGHDELAKFAELIVQECIDWCYAHAAVDGTATKIVESIKEHFGVEK